MGVSILIFQFNSLFSLNNQCLPIIKTSTLHKEGRRGRDRMVLRFTTTYAISAYH
jgi:hypothetical protein